MDISKIHQDEALLLRIAEKRALAAIALADDHPTRHVEWKATGEFSDNGVPVYAGTRTLLQDRRSERLWLLKDLLKSLQEEVPALGEAAPALPAGYRYTVYASMVENGAPTLWDAAARRQTEYVAGASGSSPDEALANLAKVLHEVPTLDATSQPA